jgi:hypothetical protein
MSTLASATSCSEKRLERRIMAETKAGMQTEKSLYNNIHVAGVAKVHEPA